MLTTYQITTGEVSHPTNRYPGYFQVNFRVQNDVVPGSAIAVRLTYLGRPSNAVTIGVQ